MYIAALVSFGLAAWPLSPPASPSPADGTPAPEAEAFPPVIEHPVSV